MRIFTFILSIYIAALSFVPCADGVEKGDKFDSSNSIVHHDHNHNHNDSNHSDDNCTPFCACACCGSMTTPPIIQPLGESELGFSTIFIFHYKFNYSFVYAEGVWHPPTVS